MFDIGWGELFLIGVVALIVVGPKDLPALFRTLGNVTGKARSMARDFQRSLEQAANEAGMSEVTKSLRSIDEGLNSATKFARSPVRAAAEAAVRGSEAPKPEVPAAEAAAESAAAPAEPTPAEPTAAPAATASKSEEGAPAGGR